MGNCFHVWQVRHKRYYDLAQDDERAEEAMEE